MKNLSNWPVWRLTITLHRIGPQLRRQTNDHFDWFFEFSDDPEDALKTFATDSLPNPRDLIAEGTERSETPPRSTLAQDAGPAIQMAAACWRAPADWLAEHRHRYLTFEGPLDGDRGDLRIAATGFHRTVVSDDQRYVTDCVVQPTQFATRHLKWPVNEPVDQPEDPQASGVQPIRFRCHFYRNVIGESPGRLCVEWEGERCERLRSGLDVRLEATRRGRKETN